MARKGIDTPLMGRVAVGVLAGFVTRTTGAKEAVDEVGARRCYVAVVWAGDTAGTGVALEDGSGREGESGGSGDEEKRKNGGLHFDVRFLSM